MAKRKTNAELLAEIARLKKRIPKSKKRGRKRRKLKSNEKRVGGKIVKKTSGKRGRKRRALRKGEKRIGGKIRKVGTGKRGRKKRALKKGEYRDKSNKIRKKGTGKRGRKPSKSASKTWQGYRLQKGRHRSKAAARKAAPKMHRIRELGGYYYVYTKNRK